MSLQESVDIGPDALDCRPSPAQTRCVSHRRGSVHQAHQTTAERRPALQVLVEQTCRPSGAHPQLIPKAIELFEVRWTDMLDRHLLPERHSRLANRMPRLLHNGNYSVELIHRNRSVDVHVLSPPFVEHRHAQTDII